MFEVLNALPALLTVRPYGAVEFELQRLELRDPDGELALTIEGQIKVRWDVAPGWIGEPPPAPAPTPETVIVDATPAPTEAAAEPALEVPPPAAETAPPPATEPEKKPAKKRTGDRHPAE